MLLPSPNPNWPNHTNPWPNHAIYNKHFVDGRSYLNRRNKYIIVTYGINSLSLVVEL